jgi:DNA-binding NtrC family response regulator
MTANLLVAEDHEAARELISHALENEGYNLVFAETGTQAAPAIQQRRFDAALIDVSLPGITGVELCRQIKSRAGTHTTPVILMSGALGARQLAEESSQVGADAFLSKPFSLDELRTVLKAFTRIREQGEELERLRIRLAEVEARLAAAEDNGHRVDLDWTLPYHDFMKLARKSYFLHALVVAHGNKSQLARKSGLDRSTLYVHLRNLGMLQSKKA